MLQILRLMAWPRVVEWEGLDTLVVCAGVSATRALLDLAGSDGPEGPSVEGVRKAGAAALRAMTVNYLGPLLSAVTMVRESQPSSSRKATT
jgi:hypothetical protein